jgi:cation:H+ antiporter
MGDYFCILLFALGLVMIIKGSDWFIDAVIWAAKVFRIPYIIIGATIVSICTTLPETFVSVTAVVKGQTAYAFGNAIGSIAVNTGFILAILLVFAPPPLENKRDFIKNGLVLVGLVLFTFMIGVTLGEINRYVGWGLLVILVLYLVFNTVAAKKAMPSHLPYDIEDEAEMTAGEQLYEGVALNRIEQEIDISRRVVSKYLAYFLLGITLVLFGSNLLVDNGIALAELLGVPSVIVAITFTAIGTSLPELVTLISSLRKKAANLGIGNIIGASILNIIQVLSVSAIIRPIPLADDPHILYILLPLVLIIVSVAVLFGVFNKKGFKRWQGLVLFMFYLVFLLLNIQQGKI